MSPIICPMCGQESGEPRCSRCGELVPLPRGACVLCGGRPARNLTLAEPFALRFASQECVDCHGRGKKTALHKLPRRTVPCTCLSSGRVCAGCAGQLSRAIPLVQRVEGGAVLLVLLIFAVSACLVTAAVLAGTDRGWLSIVILLLAGLMVIYPFWERSRAAPSPSTDTNARLQAVDRHPAFARLIEVLSQYRLTLLNASELHGDVTRRLNEAARQPGGFVESEEA